MNFPLYLRIPGWCDKANVMVNGKVTNTSLKPGSYARIEKKWKQGDVIELVLPMQLKKDTWEKNKNSVSINYGPAYIFIKD
ncbi:MAG: hypothetical protein WKG06_12195 [Segetibacter sp.]